MFIICFVYFVTTYTINIYHKHSLETCIVLIVNATTRLEFPTQSEFSLECGRPSAGGQVGVWDNPDPCEICLSDFGSCTISDLVPFPHLVLRIVGIARKFLASSGYPHVGYMV